MSENDITEIAGYMKAFGNPLRLRIIYLLLDSEKTVTDIVNSLNEKQCTVSLQLKFLMDRKIVCRRAEKKFAYYGLKERHVTHMLDMVRMGMMEAVH